MTYKQARRKYKEGLRAIPIKLSTGARWMLMDFGEKGLETSAAKRLGSEITDIFISALLEGYTVSVRYEKDHGFFVVNFRKRVGKVPVSWSYVVSYYEVVISPVHNFTELVVRAANSAFTSGNNFRVITNGFLYGVSTYVELDKSENAIIAKLDASSVDYRVYAYGILGSIQSGQDTRDRSKTIIDRRVESLMKASSTRGTPVCHEISDYAKCNKEDV
jgi:hypothetical protein